MLKDGIRFCDVCEEDILKRIVYRRSHLSAYAAALLTIDPDLTPTGTTNRDRTLSLDAYKLAFYRWMTLREKMRSTESAHTSGLRLRAPGRGAPDGWEIVPESAREMTDEGATR